MAFIDRNDENLQIQVISEYIRCFDFILMIISSNVLSNRLPMTSNHTKKSFLCLSITLKAISNFQFVEPNIEFSKRMQTRGSTTLSTISCVAKASQSIEFYLSLIEIEIKSFQYFSEGMTFCYLEGDLKKMLRY